MASFPLFARKFNIPATDSQKSLVLLLCVFAMSLMSIAIVWQAQIIADQRQMIKWLSHLQFHG